MSKTLKQVFNEVAIAIQEKTGKEEPIVAENFGQEITNIKAMGNTKNGIRFDSHNLTLDFSKLLELLPTEVKESKIITTASGDPALKSLHLAAITYFSYGYSEVDDLDLNCYLNDGQVYINWYQGEYVVTIDTTNFDENTTVANFIEAIITALGTNTKNFNFEFSGRNITEYIWTEMPLLENELVCLTTDALSEIFSETVSES